MRQMKFINILIALIAGSLLSVKAQYSYEAVFMEVGEEKTIILPSSVTSKNIVESYWSNDSPTYVDIIKKSDYSVKIKILKYTSTSCMVQYDYYWGGSREHGNYSIRIDIKKPKKLELSASPSSGSISSGSKVYLATEVNGSTVSGADIYYTTNGTSPSKSSMKYTSSGVTITQNCTLKAIAYKDGYETSEVGSWSYTIASKPELTLSANPAGGTVEKGSWVQLTASNDEAMIYYTTDGSNPKTSSTYSWPTSQGVQINESCTIKAYARLMNTGAESDVMTWTFTCKQPDVVVAEINATNFPDASFRSWLFSQSYGTDGKLTENEISSITSINVSGSFSSPGTIKSLKGIEYFTALTSLYCQNNQLTSLDVSKNTKLINLYCGYNPLVSLDVSKCIKLETIDAFSTDLEDLDITNNILLTKLVFSGNSLASLNVSNNARLTEISCSGKLLQSIDLSNNTQLTDVNFYAASLKSLDLSNCSKIENLRCERGQLENLLLSPKCKLKSFWMERNHIKGKAMDNLINSLPVNTTNEPYSFRVLVIENASFDNVCTTTQVAAAKAKGWYPLHYSNGSWVEYEGSDDTTGIKGVAAGDKEKDATIYNLSGQRLGKPRKGINIIGGKKVVVK